MVNSLYNGVDTGISDDNDSKDFLEAFNYTFNDHLQLNGAFGIGSNRRDGPSAGSSDVWLTTLNLFNRTSDRSGFGGEWIYGNTSAMGSRGREKTGSGSTRRKNDFTLTYNRDLTRDVALRGEYRYDFANERIFGDSTSSMKKSQSAISLGVLYRFPCPDDMPAGNMGGNMSGNDSNPTRR